MPPWTAVAGGLVLTVRLTPKGGRDAIKGVETLADGRSVLKVRVRTVPSEGAANAALLRLVADALDTPPARLQLAGGATSRVKRLRITGNSAVLAAALERLAGRRDMP